jgi:hypothetical protein
MRLWTLADGHGHVTGYRMARDDMLGYARALAVAGDQTVTVVGDDETHTFDGHALLEDEVRREKM